MTEQNQPEVRTIEEGVCWTAPRHFDMRTEEGAREALARVASSGTVAEKHAVREAAARDWPNIGKGLFPNSNMKP
jgi:hypothetical protein